MARTSVVDKEKNRPSALSEFEQKNRIFFYDKELLKRAFTHSSYSKTIPKVDNERLEFLGDSVVQLIVTSHLYKKFPNYQEGALTNYRSALVNTAIFADIAQELEIGKFLRISNENSKQSARRILANTFEALIGAIYLDQGYNAAEIFISKCLFQRVTALVERNLWCDWKSILQEKAQKYLQITPTYEIISESGPGNEKFFISAVKLGERVEQQGEGKSKRESEKDAAHKTLKIRGWL